MSHEARFAALGIRLPSPPSPVATYATSARHGDLIYTSGHGPVRPDGTYVVGKLGATLDVAAGRAAARLTGLGLLATLRAQLGSFDRVQRIVKVVGFVNSTPDFSEHPQVMNGFSDLFVEVFGEAAVAPRSAVGTCSLPAGIPIEIEVIVAIAGDGVTGA
jgi:enamine deaminase RidA (YjgF/YER057c/UK114 family)